MKSIKERLYLFSFGGGGGSPQSQLPSLAERQAEFLWQQEQAREDNAFARRLALEDREYSEDLARRKALRAQREEEDRLSNLELSQAEVADEAEAQISANEADVDQGYSSSNMWASLIRGTAGDQA